MCFDSGGAYGFASICRRHGVRLMGCHIAPDLSAPPDLTEVKDAVLH